MWGEARVWGFVEKKTSSENMSGGLGSTNRGSHRRGIFEGGRSFMVAFDMVSRRPRWVVPIQSFATLRGVGWVGVCTAMCMYRTGSATQLQM